MAEIDDVKTVMTVRTIAEEKHIVTGVIQDHIILKIDDWLLCAVC